jgi:hypothetical protein
MGNRQVLEDIASAKQLFQRAFDLLDQRAQRAISDAMSRVLGEYSLQTGGSDYQNGLHVGTVFSVSSPWNGDLFCLHAWCNASVAATAFSVTFSIAVAHSSAPAVLIPMTTTDLTCSPDLLIRDITSVDAETTDGSASNPANPVTLPLATAGISTELQSGDVVYVTIKGVVPATFTTSQLITFGPTGVTVTPIPLAPALFGVDLRVRLRTDQLVALPVTP